MIDVKFVSPKNIQSKIAVFGALSGQKIPGPEFTATVKMHASNLSEQEKAGLVMRRLVAFTDESTGQIDAWKWVFGDGTTSNEQNPMHQYKEAGKLENIT